MHPPLSVTPVTGLGVRPYHGRGLVISRKALLNAAHNSMAGVGVSGRSGRSGRLGPLGTAWDRSGPLGTAWDRWGPLGTLRDARDRSGPLGTPEWDSSGTSGVGPPDPPPRTLPPGGMVRRCTYLSIWGSWAGSLVLLVRVGPPPSAVNRRAPPKVPDCVIFGHLARSSDISRDLRTSRPIFGHLDRLSGLGPLGTAWPHFTW